MWPHAGESKQPVVATPLSICHAHILLAAFGSHAEANVL